MFNFRPLSPLAQALQFGLMRSDDEDDDPWSWPNPLPNPRPTPKPQLPPFPPIRRRQRSGRTRLIA